MLCLGCKKHHEKEHQNFEKVKDADVDGCECDWLSYSNKVIAYAQENMQHLTSDNDKIKQENEGDDEDT